MRPADLSKYKRERFAKNRFCSVCGGVISDNEDIEYEVHKYGHWKKYFFMHRGCYNNGQVENTIGKNERVVPQ